MEITGKIIQILPEQSGESARGSWRKQEYVLETDGQYPKKICFMAWGDKIDEFAIRETETVTAVINLESREYNGRWYTDVKAWKVSRDGAEEDAREYGPSDAYGSDQTTMDGSFLASAGSAQRKRADQNRIFHQSQGVGPSAM